MRERKDFKQTSKAIQTKLDWLNKAHIEKYESNVECEIEIQGLTTKQQKEKLTQILEAMNLCMIKSKRRCRSRSQQRVNEKARLRNTI